MRCFYFHHILTHQSGEPEIEQLDNEPTAQQTTNTIELVEDTFNDDDDSVTDGNDDKPKQDDDDATNDREQEERLEEGVDESDVGGRQHESPNLEEL